MLQFSSGSLWAAHHFNETVEYIRKRTMFDTYPVYIINCTHDSIRRVDDEKDVMESDGKVGVILILYQVNQRDGEVAQHCSLIKGD